MKYTITLKRHETRGLIAFIPPQDEGAQERIKQVLRKCRDKNADFVTVTIETPHRPRSTGKGSQNSHAWGHCTEISMALGMELYEVEYIAKVRAIKRGYPVSLKLGIPVPYSQSKISVEECNALIEEYHQIAAENGIILTEE